MLWIGSQIINEKSQTRTQDFNKVRQQKAYVLESDGGYEFYLEVLWLEVTKLGIYM